MTTLEMIKADFETFKKEKNSQIKELLKVILGEIDRLPNKNPTEDEVIKLLKKMRQNAADMKNNAEVSSIDAYLPQMLTTEEMQKLVRKIVDEHNFSTMRDLGSIMKLINASSYANLIDRKEASKYIKELLN